MLEKTLSFGLTGDGPGRRATAYAIAAMRIPFLFNHGKHGKHGNFCAALGAIRSPATRESTEPIEAMGMESTDSRSIAMQHEWLMSH